MQVPQPPQVNPYGAPLARVEDAAASDAGVLDHARSVPAGHALAWYREAWRLFKIAPGAWIGVWVVFVLLVFGVSLIPFLGFISALITPVFVGGVMIVARSADRTGDVRVGQLFAGFATQAGPLMLIGLLQLVIWFVFFIVAMMIGVAYVGFALGPQLMSGNFTWEALGPLLVVGIVSGLVYVPITMAVWLASGLTALHEIGALDSLRMGFSAAFRNLLPLIVFVLVSIPLVLLATLPFLLGWFVLGPVLLCTLYALYRDLFAIAEQPAT